MKMTPLTRVNGASVSAPGDCWALAGLRGFYFPLFHLSLVQALRFFIAMQVQHSYNSSTTTRQLMVEFTSSPSHAFHSRKKEHKLCFEKSRTHDFRTINSRCAGCLLDHSSDYNINKVKAISEDIFVLKEGKRGMYCRFMCVCIY